MAIPKPEEVHPDPDQYRKEELEEFLRSPVLEHLRARLLRLHYQYRMWPSSDMEALTHKAMRADGIREALDVIDALDRKGNT